MKKYWIVFVAVIAGCIIGLSTIIYKCFIQRPQPVMVCLSMDSLKETQANLTTTDSLRHRFDVVAIYPCGRQNLVNDNIPWADVYVCVSYSKEDSLAGDTAIILLDIKTQVDLAAVKDAYRFAADIQPTEKFKKIRVLIPVNQIDNIKKRRYKFGRVSLEDTWVED